MEKGQRMAVEAYETAQKRLVYFSTLTEVNLTDASFLNKSFIECLLLISEGIVTHTTFLLHLVGSPNLTAAVAASIGVSASVIDEDFLKLETSNGNEYDITVASKINKNAYKNLYIGGALGTWRQWGLTVLDVPNTPMTLNAAYCSNVTISYYFVQNGFVTYVFSFTAAQAVSTDTVIGTGFPTPTDQYASLTSFASLNSPAATAMPLRVLPNGDLLMSRCTNNSIYAGRLIYQLQ
jgi:hypothetical protein